nr:hypothetical protein [Tanacetum cinerariifolium]
MKPFGYLVTILSTLDPLGKFDRKADEGFFIGYSMNSKAFRVFNSRTRIVKETLHITSLENKPNIVGSRPTWLFDIDTLTKSMNYKPVVARNQSNGSTGKARVETVPDKDYILLPLWTQDPLLFFSSKDSLGDGFKPLGEEEKKDNKDPENEDNKVQSTEEPSVNQEKDVNVNSTNNITTVSPTVNDDSIKDNVVDKDIVYGCADDPNMPNLEEIVNSDEDKEVGAEADMTNLDTNIPVSPTLTTRIHKDYPVQQIIGDIHSAPQTRRMTKNVTNCASLDIGGFTICKRAMEQNGSIETRKMREELWLETKQGMIEEEVYVCQPLGFEDPEFPDRVYKIEEALYGLHQAPRSWVKGDILLVQVYVDDIIFESTRKEMCTEFEKMMDKKFHMSSMGELTFFLGLQVTQKDDGIFISRDEYVDEISKKFGFSTMRTASTPMETSKPLLKDENADDIDVYLYRSMIGSLMYIMFVVCACARFQVTPKVSHLYAVKRIFRCLKGQPKLGLWNRLVSWQCNKQIIGANSTTKAELPSELQLLRVYLVYKKETSRIEKSAENADFAEIVDFFNAKAIRYTLTVSPPIYVSYIEQFWCENRLTQIVNSDEDKEVGAEADMTNLDTNIPVSPTLTTRIHKDYPVQQIIGDIHSAPQTRRMTKNVTNC